MSHDLLADNKNIRRKGHHVLHSQKKAQAEDTYVVGSLKSKREVREGPSYEQVIADNEIL